MSTSKLFFSQSIFSGLSLFEVSYKLNVDGIEVSSFCSECALFEYVIKRECFNRQVTHFGMCGHILCSCKNNQNLNINSYTHIHHYIKACLKR